MKKIGIDIDDTVINTIDIIDKEALYFDKNFVQNRGYKDKNKYEFNERFYWDSETKRAFFKYFRQNKKYLEATPKEDAVYYLNKLYDEGYKIYFITRRSADADFDVLELTKKDLTTKGFKYTDVYIGVSKKGQKCQELGIDIFIDDSLEQILDVESYGIKTILIDNWYNKDYQKEKYSNFKDIYNKIKELI